LFKDGRTLLAGTFFVTGSIFVTYWKTGEPLLLGCALAILLVAGARGLLVRAYGRVRSKVMSAKAARRWEYRYVAGAAASLALLGMWCFLTLALTSDPFAVLVSFSMTIAYATGIFGRNFGSARFVVVQIFCAWAPMTAALLLYGNHYHWIFAGMLVPSRRRCDLAWRPDNMCAIHFVDLDQFKQVNDTLGHTRGDMLLKAALQPLGDRLRRRRVRHSAGADPFPRARRGARHAGAQRGQRHLRSRRPQGSGHRQHRNRAGHHRARPGPVPAQRRHGAVLGEGRGPRHVALVRDQDESQRPGAPQS
jgi:hypothetical protein